MKQYKIYANPQGTYEAVKQGWSWPAFFFSFIWAMVKKMWGLGVGVLVAFFALGFVIGLSLDAKTFLRYPLQKAWRNSSSTYLSAF